MTNQTHPRITEFYFLRHAPVVKRQGYLPPHDPIITNGPFDLSALEAALPRQADWYISPLQRTRQTADLLTPSLAPKSTTLDERLVEMNYGEWHDRPIAEVWDEIADSPHHNWSFIMPETTPPNGESFLMLFARIGKWMEDKAKQHLTSPQIVVTHSGVISAVMGHILGLDPVKAIGISPPNFALLRANLMEAECATDAGGPWQFVSLGVVSGGQLPGAPRINPAD